MPPLPGFGNRKRMEKDDVDVKVDKRKIGKPMRYILGFPSDSSKFERLTPLRKWKVLFHGSLEISMRKIVPTNRRLWYSILRVVVGHGTRILSTWTDCGWVELQWMHFHREEYSHHRRYFPHHTEPRNMMPLLNRWAHLVLMNRFRTVKC